MSKFISIDQSMAACAVIVWEGDEIMKPIEHYVIRTGSNTSKADKLDAVKYFNTDHEQIKYICDRIIEITECHDISSFVFENLSFGSTGNAVRQLAGLLYTAVQQLLRRGYCMDDISFLAVPTVKSYARTLYPEDQQRVSGKLIKMGKKEMVFAASTKYADILNGYNMSGIKAGKGDLADALMIGECWISKQGKSAIG